MKFLHGVSGCHFNLGTVIEGIALIFISAHATILDAEATFSVGSPRSTARMDTLAASDPEFLVEPEELYYAMKNRPVSLVCRATGASKLNFRCGDKWVEPTHQVSRNGTDERTGKTYVETSVDIYRAELDGFNEQSKDEQYWCECRAWGSNLQTPYKNSRRALIRIPYLRRYFEREPLSVSVEYEASVHFQCLPPEGLPNPETYWLKNNEPIDANKEINYIITSEGDLLINQAKFSDQGNYTCVAENIASRRYSEAAFLTVHVSGKWSTWSQWSECPPGCGRKQKRQRFCNNPEPLNGGPECVGEAEQERICSKPCQVDGRWSEWSSWSACGPNCQRYRRRLCDNPPPSYGGKTCPDHDLDTLDCCINSPTNDSSTWNIVPYVGLALALVLFIIVVTVVVLIFLLRHRRQRKDFPGGVESKVQPEVTHTVVPFLHGARYSADKSLDYCPDDDVMSYQLLYQRFPDTSESDGITEPLCTSQVDQNSVCQYGLRSEDPIVWSNVTSAGGRLDLPRSGVSLILPEGTVKTPTDFFLTVCRDDSRKMRLTGQQTHLSPIVACGCRGNVKPEKPLVITFQHSACVENQSWSLSLYGCDLNSSNTWKLISSVEGQTSASSDQKTFVHIDNNLCHVVTSNMMNFALIGQPKLRHSACKYIQLAAFASSFVPSKSEHSIRIYFVENTADALESIVEVENRLGSSLFNTPKVTLLEHGCGNLCLALEILDRYRWSCRRSSNYQEIPFSQIWNGIQSDLHCSFTLEYDSFIGQQQNLIHPAASPSCAVQIYQKNLPERHETIQLTLNNDIYRASSLASPTEQFAGVGLGTRREHLGIV